jgi:hypothetical protein
MTLRAIGRQYGLSGERVRQLTSPKRAKHDAMTRRTKKLQTETPETVFRIVALGILGIIDQ